MSTLPARWIACLRRGAALLPVLWFSPASFGAPPAPPLPTQEICFLADLLSDPVILTTSIERDCVKLETPDPACRSRYQSLASRRQAILAAEPCVTPLDLDTFQDRLVLALTAEIRGAANLSNAYNSVHGAGALLWDTWRLAKQSGVTWGGGCDQPVTARQLAYRLAALMEDGFKEFFVYLRSPTSPAAEASRSNQPALACSRIVADPGIARDFSERIRERLQRHLDESACTITDRENRVRLGRAFARIGERQQVVALCDAIAALEVAQAAQASLEESDDDEGRPPAWYPHSDVPQAYHVTLEYSSMTLGTLVAQIGAMAREDLSRVRCKDRHKTKGPEHDSQSTWQVSCRRFSIIVQPDPLFDQTVAVNIHNRPWPEALETLARKHGFHVVYEPRPYALVVVPGRVTRHAPARSSPRPVHE
ncbi:exported hypothetical protein [Gammaproteobacteria bacterium]